MNIDIIISADDIKPEKILNKTILIIDMLRATSVIVTALYNGCKEVIPVLTVDEALNIAKKDRDKYVLGGERNALKIEGFDFSNSPLDYDKEYIKGKSLIITTTNGTKAIKRSIGAERILIGALINAKATADKILKLNNDLVIVNAGTYGHFSMDDFICAGYIINCISENTSINPTDIAKTAQYIYKNNEDIVSFIKHASHYKRIKELNLKEDLKYCCLKDIINIVPEYKDDIIRV
ncbi:putative 2-phosphosulfolactate phosphatase [Clostridium acetireducens DSM 10703]|jgi:2-phosphosulfolactate phosphatase|uniref:Probable 2-phosphosulfolactate phosphatase n=1 Tax=Clostridium acetireducens DSM 10703 TaxID=1121290 RepID=A0A1E8F0D3_9CLOT|nr:2-phosphosulfolactate phosphatase family protein [Clostridium acetireducens]OFI06589.1 putative 2-phosphosulfolactate phosphatase [Clostridium acetireducens DSM 10703]